MQVSFDDLGTPLFDAVFTVLDLETTGLSPQRDRITEIGAVKVRAGEVLGEFQCLVRPGVPIPATVTSLTGISDLLVADRPPIEAALPALLEFLRGTTFVAHNAHFDLGFLQAACRTHGYPPLELNVIDTARLARRVLGRDEVRDVRLATLAHHLRARVKPEHRALTDARATVDVFHALLERSGSLGVVTLEDLRDYTRSTSDPTFRRISLVDGAPDLPGVYRFVGTDDEVLYVGKATCLRERLRTYFGQDPRRKVADLIRETVRVEWEVAPTVLEAGVRELRAIHRHRPRYNRASRQPGRAVYVKLTRERFPRLSVVTAIRDETAVHVGPLSRRAAERFVDAVHDALPLRRCTDRITAKRGRSPCVLKDLGRCGAPCDGSQGVAAYDEVVRAYVGAVTGDPTPLLDVLRGRMERHARLARFERASELRERLHAISRIVGEQRRLAALVAADEVIAVRQLADGAEIVVVRRGRFGASERIVGSVDDGAVAVAAERLSAIASEPPAGPPPREDLEEMRLVAAWLEGPDVRLVRCSQPWAEPLSGGANIASLRDESRIVARALRRDRQVLRGEKVARRSA